MQNNILGKKKSLCRVIQNRTETVYKQYRQNINKYHGYTRVITKILI